MIPAVSHSIGPSVAKYAPTSCSNKYPKKAAKPIEIIADPGNAKATGYPEANATIIIITRRAKNKCSINYLFKSL